MASESYVHSDAGNHSFMQHQTDPGWAFTQHAAQILFTERFLLPHRPLCLLFCNNQNHASSPERLDVISS